MQKYIQQLLADIEDATGVMENVPRRELSLEDWISQEAEEENAPKRVLSEWTGIRAEMLPPAAMLNEKQIQQLLEALNRMLSAYNCHFVLQTEVPELFQYETIRQNIDQVVTVKEWHMGFFEMCKPGTPPTTCSLGDYCQCAFFKEFISTSHR